MKILVSLAVPHLLVPPPRPFDIARHDPSALHDVQNKYMLNTLDTFLSNLPDRLRGRRQSIRWLEWKNNKKYHGEGNGKSVEVLGEDDRDEKRRLVYLRARNTSVLGFSD